jgi:putative hemolysin
VTDGSTTPTGTDRFTAPRRADAPRVYDRRSLTYSNTFESPVKRQTIRAIEWATGKVTILRRIREFERRGTPTGQAFWRACLDVMRVDLLTPPEEIARIPATGPVVLVANHPHGLVDGMILADLVGRVRPDYRILTRSILTGIDESAAQFMIPVPFPHEPDAQRKMLDMRATALAHLRAGGLLALFPSGVVASAPTMFAPAVEAEWNVFTAKLIRTSGAAVLPVFFPGANSRAYQIANRLSPTLRQGLLLHEIVHALDRPQRPVVGQPITPADMASRHADPRALMAWLRETTLALGQRQRVGTGTSPR